nr:uridine phosphorylase 1-like [Onthophagus taurus]
MEENVFCECKRWNYGPHYNIIKDKSMEKCPLCSITRNLDGTIMLRNKNISSSTNDFLYHLGLGTSSNNLQEMFGDVKFVCMGGTPHRMEAFARHLIKILDRNDELIDLTGCAKRYSMFKVGPVIAVNHGMGYSSCTILLHEVIKLMFHAKCKDPIFIRLGTSGGIGVEPGTVVVSSGGVDARLRDCYEIPIAGKLSQKLCRTDFDLIENLKSVVTPSDHFKVITGKTMAATDFYEEQGRLDGAFCGITETEKLDYLKKLYEGGVRNIEMESVPFFAYTHYAGIKAADVCVTLIDRLKGDQVITPKSKLSEFENYPQEIVGRFIKKQLEQFD